MGTETLERDWSDYGTLKHFMATATDAEMLLYVQTLARPYDPVLYREMCRRGLVGRWERLERTPPPQDRNL